MEKYKHVDVRLLQEKGVDFVRAADKRVKKAFRKVVIWAPQTVPSRLWVTPEQFKTMAQLQGNPDTTPKGKEMFKTSDGYILEIIVKED